MVYFHVRLSLRGEKHDEVKNDLTEEALERQILDPYRSGQPVTMNGKTMDWDQVERVRISASEHPSSVLIEQLKAADRNSSVLMLGGASYSSRAAARARDVTDEYITGPSGAAVAKNDALLNKAEQAEPDQQAVETTAAGSVFVIAGRDSRAASGIGDFLRALGLQVVEWEHAVARTGLPNPYVGDVVVTGLRMATAALVLITPDDLVQLRTDLLYDEDGPDEREVRGQARPNVYYEAGFADALGRERTVIVEMGNVKSFSDAAGRHVVRYDGSPSKRNVLAERLRLAGLNVNTGGQEWLKAGDVEGVLSAAREALDAGPGMTGSRSVDRATFIQKVDKLLTAHQEMQARSIYDDLSDLPEDSLDITIRTQALIDEHAAGTPYAAELEKVRGGEPHERIPVLMAVLRALRSEADVDAS